MAKDQESGALKPDLFFDSIEKFVPQLSSSYHIEIEIPFLLDSAELNFSNWQILIKIIKDYVDKVDGIVITHGTDTLVYTASALSYMLLNLPIPVVLTGAQKPLHDLRTDARNNLINSFELAASGIQEVAIFFNHQLIRGNRAIKSHINHFDAFSSPNYPSLAEVGIEIEIYWNNVLKPRGIFHIFDRFDSSLAVLKLFPGCETGYFQPSEEVKAVLIIAYGAGTVPLTNTKLLKQVEVWIKQNKLVVLMSETMAGSTDLRLYESGNRLLKMGVLSTGDMTFPAVVTKIMFLLGQYQEMSMIKKNFCRSLAGEISEINH